MNDNGKQEALKGLLIQAKNIKERLESGDIGIGEEVSLMAKFAVLEAEYRVIEAREYADSLGKAGDKPE